MVEVPLTKGKVALIDDEDAPTVLAYKWTAMHVPRSKKWYARRGFKGSDGKQKTMLLHRFILGAPSDKQVDHINNDGLDNRRANLRLCTNAQNHHNMGLTTRNKTGFKGIMRKSNGRYLVHVRAQNKVYHVGTFRTAEEAARAYDSKAKELHGEFARLNFPEEKGAVA